MEEIELQLLEEVRENRKIRQRVAFEHPLLFALSYLKNHFDYELAPFHLEMFHLIEQLQYEIVVVMAFRESGKSTILNMANTLWSILGKPQKKFVLIVSQTQDQAKNHFANIKAELENNELLREDFGPFTETKEGWNKLSLELEYHGSKIMSVTRDQSVRGLKYGQFRPDLIICDDLEDITSVNNEKEGEVLYRRFMNEIIPLGSANTRIVILGNFLSRESLIMRLKSDVDTDRIKVAFRAYPLLDNNGKILWPGKFPDREVVKRLRAKLSKEAWKQEYMLNTASTSCDWLEPDERPETIVCRQYERKLEELKRKYGYGLPQPPLIAQMRKFSISVFQSEPDDPGGQRYQEFKEEARKLGREFEEEFKQVLLERWRPNDR